MNNLVYLFPGKVYFGKNSLKKLKEISLKENYKSVVFVTDKELRKIGILDKAIKVLEKLNLDIHVVSDVPREPDVNYIDSKIKDFAKISPDAIIGIGGGSVLDASKIFALYEHIESSSKDYIGIGLLNGKGKDKILIPTTSGTGSEATMNAILSIKDEHRKAGIVSESLVAQYVILDPTLIMSLPKKITAFTGMDAFAHAIECYISKKSNIFSDILALESMRLINENLEKTYDDGKNIEARENMLFASFLAGLCINFSGTTAVHAMAYPIGGTYNVPHGLANAMLLPHVMEYDLVGTKEKFNIIEKKLNIQEDMDIVKRLFQLNENLNIAKNLSDLGIKVQDTLVLSKLAMKVTRLLSNNPVKMDINDINKIYSRIV